MSGRSLPGQSQPTHQADLMSLGQRGVGFAKNPALPFASLVFPVAVPGDGPWPACEGRFGSKWTGSNCRPT